MAVYDPSFEVDTGGTYDSSYDSYADTTFNKSYNSGIDDVWFLMSKNLIYLQGEIFSSFLIFCLGIYRLGLIFLNQIMRDTFSKTIENNDESIENLHDKLRILLWDIDGTLMCSTVRGGYKKYFSATMQKVFGSAGNLDDITPSGMTDTQIMFEALKNEGFTPENIMERTREILEVFKPEMQKVLAADGEPFELLGGVEEILAETDKNPNFVNALLTGNLSVAAELKLRAVGIWDYFKVAPNAFGEISHKRNDLAIEAGKLANNKYDFQFKPEQFIVIGDTPNDIACARHFGAKVIAVATGKNQSSEKLSASKPDAILDNLKNTSKVLELLSKI